MPQFRRARCPHRAAGWFFSQKEFRRPGGEFLSARAERNQRAAKGWAQSAGTALPPLPPCRPPPGPPFTGVTPWTRQNISGAQNLSGFLRFLPGHWALGLQKLPLLRFHDCAWLCSPNDTGAVDGGRPKGLPYPPLQSAWGGRPMGRRTSRLVGRGLAPAAVPCLHPFPRPGQAPALRCAVERNRVALCRGGYQPPASLPPSSGNVCEADEGELRNGSIPSAGRPVSGPCEKRNGFQERRRGGTPGPPTGRSGTGTYKKNGNVPASTVGAGPRPARYSPEPHLSPTNLKRRAFNR